MMFDILKMVHFNPQITGAFYPQIDTWHARTFYARESGGLGSYLLCPETGTTETTGKVKDYKPVVKSTEKSDGVIVAKKLLNLTLYHTKSSEFERH